MCPSTMRAPACDGEQEEEEEADAGDDGALTDIDVRTCNELLFSLPIFCIVLVLELDTNNGL